jgi:WD40 repeat protein
MLCVWAPDTGKIKFEMKESHTHEIRCLAFMPDGKQLISGSWDGKIKIWDLETGKLKLLIEPECKKIENFVLFDDGKKLMIACDQCFLWDLKTNERIRTYGMGGVISAAVSPDKKTLLTGWYDGKIRQWKIESGDLVAEYQAHEAYSFWMDFSPDGKNFATAGGGDYNNGNPLKGKDHVVRIWKFEEE